MSEKKYKTEYCKDCDCEIVVCPKCGQMCHFGNYGQVPILDEWEYDEINDEYVYAKVECDACPAAYEHQREIAPELHNAYGTIYMNDMELGYTNKNHFSVTASA